MDTIASLDLVEVSSSGKREPMRVEIGRPRYDERGSWACPIFVPAIDTKVREIHGEDSMQALCLALRFVHSMLQIVVKRGGRLLDPQEGTDFPLDAYFGSNGQPSDAPNDGPATSFDNPAPSGGGHHR
jgi:hypothetical protein